MAHFYPLEAHVCRADDDLPVVPCCDGAAARAHCTCWEPLFNARQERAQVGPVGIRPSCCGDCAFRPDSPERLAHENDEDADVLLRSTWEGTQNLVRAGTPFYCHQGMRQHVGDLHPDGRLRDAGPHDYVPGKRNDGVPIQADGQPALVCAGWAAARARYLELVDDDCDDGLDYDDDRASPLP